MFFGYKKEIERTTEPLTTLPKEIGALENLTYLWLSNNNLTQLPDEIMNLKKISFDNNPDLIISEELSKWIEKIPS